MLVDKRLKYKILTLLVMGIFGSLIGGLLGISAQNSANEANLQAVRETNEANAREAQLQREWNYNLWQENNKYNSPLQQMQRLREAGLNPNLVYGNGVTGNTSSPAAPGNASVAQAGRVESLAPIIQHAVDMYYSTQMNDAQVQSVRLKNDEQALVNQFLRETYVARKSTTEHGERRAFYDAENANSVAFLNNMRVEVAQRLHENGMDYKQAYAVAENAVYQAQNALKQGRILDEQAKDYPVRRLFTRAQTRLANANAALAEEDLRSLNSTGITSRDPAVVRVIARYIDKLVGGNVFDKSKSFGEKVFNKWWSGFKKQFTF